MIGPTATVITRTVIRFGALPSRWIGWLGVVTAASGLLGMFRNVTGAVAPIAALNNYLLPVFMIVLGVALARWRASEVAAG